MGGKTSQSSQSVSIPPEVLARYNSVNARAEQVAQTPFQPYTDQFVAGLTPTQTAGIQNTSASATQAQPYYNAATGLTLSGAQDVGALTQNQIGYYQNPYTQAVAAPTLQALQQQQGQERSQQQAQAIKSGAAFGERSGLQRAQLAGQQNLATAQAIAPIYQQGYQQAVQTAQGQQGVVAADLARRMQAGQQVAGIGTAAQQAGLQGAQAQIAAGTVEQQTQQADLTAKYQQFLQQRGYDFQTAQFLANIAMGTGALSGSTTTTTQPQGFFSDERLKHDARRIGETDDGLPIYSYKYNGDNKTQIGLMAQDVEKRKPEAVGLAPASDGKMYKTVDYDKVTRTNKDYGGGVMGDYDPSSMGGAVAPGLAGEGFADGGMPGMPNMGGMPGVSSYVPAANLPIGRLMIADPKLLRQNQAGLGSAVETGKNIAGLYDMGKSGIAWGKKQLAAKGGLIVPRHGYATDGSVDDSDPTPYNYAETKAGEDPMKDVLSSGAKAMNSLPKPGAAPGQARGIGNDIMDAANMAKGVGDLYSAGSSFMKFLPMVLPLADGGRTPFAYGGLIPRQHHADGERVLANGTQDSDSVVSADGGGGDEPTYKIAPQRKEEMEPHWQQFINRTYAGEGGMDENGKPRYNIRQGGKETFNPEEGHPGPGKPMGGESSAAGAGQFIHGTWNRITGGAPMTQGYQDAATKELAMQDYKARTGRDLDADLKEQGLSPQILKTLSPTWTSFNQGLSPPGMIGRSERAPSTYSGKGAGEASLGDVASEYLPQGTPTSANFWVPALAGLGSMLASKNQTLLGAVGEGLVGGVSGYQAQYKQKMDATKTVFDIIQNTFQETRDAKGNVAFRNKRTGDLVAPQQVQASVSKMLEAAGIDPAFAGISKTPPGGLVPTQAETSIETNKNIPAAIPTVSTTPPRPQIPAGRQQPTLVGEAQPVPEKITDKPVEEWSPTEIDQHVRENGPQYGLTGPNNPITLQKRVDQLKAQAASFAEVNPAQSNIYDRQAQEEQKRLDELVSRAASRQLDVNKKISEQRLGSADDFAKAIQKRDEVYTAAKSQMMELSRLQGQGLKSGYGAETQRDINSLLKTLGVSDPKYYVGSNDPTDYDYAAKIAMQQIVSNLAAAGLQRAPKAGIDVEKKITPGGNVDPGAIYSLIGHTLGDMEYVRDRDREYLTKHRYSDPTAFTFNYNDKMGDRGYNKSIAKAFSQLDLPTNDKNVSQLTRNLFQKYGQYGYRPKGVDIGGEDQQQSAPTTSVPSSGKSTTNVPWKVVP